MFFITSICNVKRTEGVGVGVGVVGRSGVRRENGRGQLGEKGHEYAS